MNSNTITRNIPRFKLLLATVILSGSIMTLLAVGQTVVAQNGSFEDDVENPQEGSLGLAGVVEGEPPEDAAAINTPVDGETFTQAPITVIGTCTPELIVEVYTNDSFAGSVMCDDNGTFELEIMLFRGENELTTRVRDLLGQTGPESGPVTVFYEPQVTASDREIGPELLLTSSVSFRGAAPGSEITFPLRLAGGSSPYAVSVNWGDGNDGVISRSDTGSFDITHAYDRPGVYRIVVRATDDNDRAAFLQLTAVVDGEVDGGLVDDTTPARVDTQYTLWPLYILGGLVPVAFWLGMRHMKRKYE